MKKLIYHDLKVLQNSLFVYFFLLVAVSFLVEGSEYLSGFIFTATLLQILHYHLYKNKSENILVSFPITRKQIVLARYVSALIITTINTLIPLCVLTLLYLFDQSQTYYPIIEFAIFLFVITLFYLFLYLPFHFRYSYSYKTSVVIFSLILFFTSFVLIPLLNIITDDAEIFPREFVAQEQQGLWFILGSIAFLIILGLFSLWCSIHLYRKREF